MIPPTPKDQLRAIIGEIVERNKAINDEQDLIIDIIFSGGLKGSTMSHSGIGAHLYVAVQALEQPPPELYKTGVALATFPHQRLCPDVKLMNYIGAILAHQTVVQEQNAFEVLFISPIDKQTILEGSTFTTFFVDGKGEVHTPPLDGRILDSVTRRALLELLSPRKDFRIHENSLTMDMLPTFREAFLVSTTRNVLPVIRIDDKLLGQGKPGPVTESVMALFNDYLSSY